MGAGRGLEQKRPVEGGAWGRDQVGAGPGPGPGRRWAGPAGRVNRMGLGSEKQDLNSGLARGSGGWPVGVGPSRGSRGEGPEEGGAWGWVGLVGAFFRFVDRGFWRVRGRLAVGPLAKPARLPQPDTASRMYFCNKAL